MIWIPFPKSNEILYSKHGIIHKHQRVKSNHKLPFSSTHSLNHFFAKLHWWWKWLWITTENEAKINMEKASIIPKEKVVKMPTEKRLLL